MAKLGPLSLVGRNQSLPSVLAPWLRHFELRVAVAMRVRGWFAAWQSILIEAHRRHDSHGGTLASHVEAVATERGKSKDLVEIKRFAEALFFGGSGSQ